MFQVLYSYLRIPCYTQNGLSQAFFNETVLDLKIKVNKDNNLKPLFFARYAHERKRDSFEHTFQGLLTKPYLVNHVIKERPTVQ